jgi:hypothetical protein
MEFKVTEDDELRHEIMKYDLDLLRSVSSALEAGGLFVQEPTHPRVPGDVVPRDRPLEIQIAGVAVLASDLRGDIGQAGEQRRHRLVSERRWVTTRPVTQLSQAELFPEQRRIERGLVEEELPLVIGLELSENADHAGHELGRRSRPRAA